MAKGKKDEGGISKMDAVRAVLGKHGNDTMPVDIVDHVKKEHGLDITTGTASNYKGTILKELKETPAAKAPAVEKPAPAPASKPRKGKEGKVNKLEAVRQVIRDHGKETTASEIVKLAKKEHGAEMGVDMASTYKTTALKQLGLFGNGKAKPGPKPGRKPGPKPAQAKAAVSGDGSISLDDIQAVKALVDRLGGEKLRQLAVVLA